MIRVIHSQPGVLQDVLVVVVSEVVLPLLLPRLCLQTLVVLRHTMLQAHLPTTVLAVVLVHSFEHGVAFSHRTPHLLGFGLTLVAVGRVVNLPSLAIRQGRCILYGSVANRAHYGFLRGGLLLALMRSRGSVVDAVPA